MPQLPLRYDEVGGGEPASLCDLSVIGAKAALDDERKQEAYAKSRKLDTLLIQIRSEIGTEAAKQKLQEIPDHPNYAPYIKVANSGNNDDSSDSAARHGPREANFSHRVEETVNLLAYQHFLETSLLLPPSAVPWASDEEYLAGACMGLAQDMGLYGLGRATVRDVESVQAAAALVRDILQFLLQIDFRNGPLRRKYDGTKYCLKDLETLLYELSVTGAPIKDSDKDAEMTNEAKRQKSVSELLPTDELDALAKRVEKRDELRETLIKKSRDGQKAAKNSIYSLHRNDKDRALDLIEKSRKNICEELLPIVQQDPMLRFQGCFQAVLEEYVEARLFAAWLHGKEAVLGSGGTATGSILKFTDFEDLGFPLEAEEYIGGLSDLTGEVGRYAVARGTARDADGVKECLRTNDSILTSLQMMERLPSGSNKKVDAVKESVKKLRRMLYELSLSEAAGGRNVHSEVEEMQET